MLTLALAHIVTVSYLCTLTHLSINTKHTQIHAFISCHTLLWLSARIKAPIWSSCLLQVPVGQCSSSDQALPKARSCSHGSLLPEHPSPLSPSAHLCKSSPSAISPGRGSVSCLPRPLPVFPWDHWYLKDRAGGQVALCPQSLT